jgi:hypothetical protein
MTVGQLIHLVKDVSGTMGRMLHQLLHPEGADKQGSDGKRAEGWALVRKMTTSLSTRSKFRQTINDALGEIPEGKSWKAELTEMLSDGLKARGLKPSDRPHYASANVFLEYICKGLNLQGRSRLQLVIDAGYTVDDAQFLLLMNTASVRVALGEAIEHKSKKFTVITHAVYDAIGKKASNGIVAPKCYCHLRGLKNGAADLDGRWDHVLAPDETGFRGFTSYMPMKLRPAEQQYYSPDGIGERSAGLDGYKTMESTVICVESAAAQEQYLHSAVNIGLWYILPPFTLLEVVKVQGPGDWEYLPGKRINQTLITVRPTYLISAKMLYKGPAEKGGSSKFASNRTFLSYGSSQDAARGIEDITSTLVLTMEQEWMRGGEWTDYRGNGCHAADEWQYVTEPVDLASNGSKRGTGVGIRDEGGGGGFLAGVGGAGRGGGAGAARMCFRKKSREISKIFCKTSSRHITIPRRSSELLLCV